MDNGTTAMTGHQDHPAMQWPINGKSARPIDIEAVVRAMGVEKVRVVNAVDVKEVEEGLRDCFAYEGVAMLITRGLCAKISKSSGGVYWVDQNTCAACGTFFRLGCPAVVKSGAKNPKTGRHKAVIDPTLCVGCDMCKQVCPTGAIHAPVEKEAH